MSVNNGNMLNEIFIPDKQHHSIELSKELYGKKVQVIAYEIVEDVPPLTKKKGLSSFWYAVEFNRDFPSLEETKRITWVGDIGNVLATA